MPTIDCIQYASQGGGQTFQKTFLQKATPEAFGGFLASYIQKKAAQGFRLSEKVRELEEGWKAFDFRREADLCSLHVLEVEDQAPSSKPELPEGTYTCARADGSYRTYRLQVVKEGNLAGRQVLKYLSGPDNSTDFIGFAFIEAGAVRCWKKFKDGQLAQEVVQDWAAISGDIQLAGETYAMRSGRCCRCGRKLTVPASLHRGMGPECAAKG